MTKKFFRQAAIVAAAALVAPVALADVTMTCGSGNKATVEVKTGSGWQMNGEHTSGWQSAFVVPAANPLSQAGNKAGNWNATFADWLTPGNMTAGIGTLQAHHWRTKVTLDDTVDPSTVKMVAGSSTMYADDYMNSIHVVQDDSTPAGTAKAYTGHRLDGTGFVDGLGGEPKVSLTGNWAAGDNWLVFKLSNDDYEDAHSYFDSVTDRTGPLGFSAIITLEADCVPPITPVDCTINPTDPACVLVDAPPIHTCASRPDKKTNLVNEFTTGINRGWEMICAKGATDWAPWTAADASYYNWGDGAAGKQYWLYFDDRTFLDHCVLRKEIEIDKYTKLDTINLSGYARSDNHYFGWRVTQDPADTALLSSPVKQTGWSAPGHALTAKPAEGSWQVGKNYIILEHKNDGGPTGIRADIKMEAECDPIPTGGGNTAPVPVNSPWMLGALGAGLALLGARSRRKENKE